MSVRVLTTRVSLPFIYRVLLFFHMPLKLKSSDYCPLMSSLGLSMMPESEGRGSVWSGQETLALLEMWVEKDIQKGSGVGCRNKNIYKSLAAQMADKGFYHRPWDRVRDKINRLKTDYRKIKERDLKSGEDSEESVMKPVWFDTLDRVLGSRPAATRPTATGSFVVDSGASSWDSLSSLAGSAGDEVKPRVHTQHADEEFDAESMDTKPDAVPLRTAPHAVPLQMAPHAQPLKTAPGAELRNEPASRIKQIEPAKRNGVPTAKRKIYGISLLNTSGTTNHPFHQFSSNEEFDDIDSSQEMQVHHVTEAGWISEEDEIDCEEPRTKLRCKVDSRHHQTNPKRGRILRNTNKDETVKDLVTTLIENNTQRDKVLMEAEDAHRKTETERHTEEIKLLRDQIQLEREKLQFERERLQFEREERERMELTRREEVARSESLRREEMDRTEKARLDERDREERRFSLMMALIKGTQNNSN